MLGHQDVQRDRVEALAAQLRAAPRSPLVAIVGLDLERRQLVGDQLGDLALVVDDQHPAALDDVERVAVSADRPRPG